ncbi:hypothetical protein [Kitasatospora purpeofusca]|uniref:hypothetical protein n=1 Tax=Kitasatospora purpeofusca TaxID=67352 RepID=UPI0012FE8D20|nr:hypothetical protein [Kitasatospora purpeofusca]
MASGAAGAPSAPSTSSPAARLPPTIAIGTDGVISHAYNINGSRWSQWASLGGWKFKTS